MVSCSLFNKVPYYVKEAEYLVFIYDFQAGEQRAAVRHGGVHGGDWEGVPGAGPLSQVLFHLRQRFWEGNKAGRRMDRET